MFDLLPNLISSILTILFPIFASHKALRTSDPALLSPWLMYWISFSLSVLFDQYTYWLLSWIPLYAYLRLFLLSYLVLPQTQGARLLYQTYIHPFLAHHEAQIERFISAAHDKARVMGLDYLSLAIAFVKRNVLGWQPSQPPRSPHRHGGGGGGGRDDGATYAQNLLSRFNLPTARDGLAAPAGDFYGLLSSAVGTLGRTPSSGSAVSRDGQVEQLLQRGGSLIPQTITSPADKLDFLTSQREKLRVLLSALDKEASGLEIERDVERRVVSGGGGRGGGGGWGAFGAPGEPLQKSKSEAEFDTIDKDEAAGQGAGSWMPWGWGAQGKEDHGRATGFDRE